MAHPYQSVRQSKVERSRVADLTGGYPSSPEKAVAKKTLAKSPARSAAVAKMEGKPTAMRLDKFARGGKVKKAQTNVNVIIAPQGGGPKSAMPPPVLPPPPMAGPGLPPPGAMPPGGSGGPGGLPPPMLPGQKNGGRAYAKGGRAYAHGGGANDTPSETDNPMGPGGGDKDPSWYRSVNKKPSYARGGKVSDGPAFREGIRNGTQVQHTDGKNDQDGLGRGKPITYSKGGGVEARNLTGRRINPATMGWKAQSGAKMGMPKGLKYATGGPVEAGTSMGPDMHAGAYSGEGRLEKITMQKRSKRP